MNIENFRHQNIEEKGGEVESKIENKEGDIEQQIEVEQGEAQINMAEISDKITKIEPEKLLETEKEGVMDKIRNNIIEIASGAMAVIPVPPSYLYTAHNRVVEAAHPFTSDDKEMLMLMVKIMVAEVGIVLGGKGIIELIKKKKKENKEKEEKL